MSDKDAAPGRSGDDPGPVADRMRVGIDRFLARFDRLELRLDAAGDRSRVGSLQSRARSVIADSRIVQWLRQEPTSDPIVVDLRETWSVGPFLRVGERGIARATPALRAAKESRVRAGVHWLEAHLIAALGIGLLGVVLWVVSAWETLSPLATVALALVTISGLGLVGLVRTRAAVENSTALGVAVALLAPPADPGRP